MRTPPNRGAFSYRDEEHWSATSYPTSKESSRAVMKRGYYASFRVITVTWASWVQRPACRSA